MSQSKTKTISIFSDAATSAKASVSVGIFLCLDEKHIEEYTNNPPHNLSTELARKVIYEEFKTKKSTWVEIKIVIDALYEVLAKSGPGHQVEIYTDCQSLCDLLNRRKENLKKTNFLTRTGRVLANANLYKKLFDITDKFQIRTFKLKGHDLIVRRLSLHEKIFSILDKLCRKKLRSILKNF